MRLAGQYRLQVQLFPAEAHDSLGHGVVKPPHLDPAEAPIVDLRQSCDFEADVTWVAGLLSRNGFRVIRLAHPNRLVIDFRKTP